MSYDNRDNREGDYSRPNDPREYGGGGRGSDNYYSGSGGDQSNEDSQQQRRGEYGSGGDPSDDSYGRQQQGEGGRYGGADSSYSGQQQEHQSSYSGDNQGRYNDQSGSYGGGSSGGYGSAEGQFGGAMQHAEQHAGESGSNSIFSHALDILNKNHDDIKNNDIDEQGAVQAHQAVYGGGSGGNQQHSADTLGAGAAMQALKMFTSHGGGQGEAGGLGGGAGGGQNKLIGLAMAQASKLFDEQKNQGNVDASADKQKVVTQAAEMAFKMYMKSQMSGAGASGSAGSGGLMNLASKFLG